MRIFKNKRTGKVREYDERLDAHILKYVEKHPEIYKELIFI